MRLEPLYRIRFTYPEGWAVGLDGGWEQHFYLAEGRCEGRVNGRFRGANVGAAFHASDDERYRRLNDVSVCPSAR